MKKTPGDIIILHMCTKNYDQMMYGSWDMVRDRQTDRQTDGRKKWHMEEHFSKLISNKNNTFWELLSHSSDQISQCLNVNLNWCDTRKLPDLKQIFPDIGDKT